MTNKLRAADLPVKTLLIFFVKHGSAVAGNPEQLVVTHVFYV